MTLRLRELSEDEQREVQRIARSHTLKAGLVRRAQIIVHAMNGLKAEDIARRMALSGNTVRLWLNRFNAQGLPGLEDEARPGRPPTYTAEQRAEVVATALTDPKGLGLPFACWTLDRLVAYLHEEKGIPIKRSRLDELLIAEGLRWRTHETWFGERVDPEFAQKRGPSQRSIWRLRRVV